MQIETKDLKAITKKFFAVYGAHDVERVRRAGAGWA